MKGEGNGQTAVDLKTKLRVNNKMYGFCLGLNPNKQVLNKTFETLEI